MFASIQVTGLLGLADTVIELDPTGTTEITGPSESGKTTLLTALCWFLWNVDLGGRPLPLAAIREGAERAEVVVVSARGTRMKRTIARVARGHGKKDDRIVTRAFGDQNVRSEVEWLLKFGKLGSEASSMRLAMVPMSWTSLAWQPGQSAEGNGRPLRDALRAILPSGDVGAEVARLMAEAEHQVYPRDSMDETSAMASRAAARKAADEAAGAVAEAARRLAEQEQPAHPPVPEEDVQAARRVLAVAEAWAAHRRARTSYDSMIAAAADWDQRAAALGEPPPAAELQQARDALAAERSQAEIRARQVAAASLEVAQARAEVARLNGAPVPSEEVTRLSGELEAAGDELRALQGAKECPTCHRPWEGWEAARDEAVRRVEDLERRLEELQDEARRALEVERERAERHLGSARERERLAQEEQVRAQAREATRRQYLAELDARHTAHQRSRAALGKPPSRTLREPAAPEVPEPSAEDIEAARVTLRHAEERAAVASELRLQAARARDAHAAAQARAGATKAEAARLDALVAAVRAAPSIVTRRQADALGDLGPVSLRWLDEGGVEVLVDGRPWWLASTGRRIVADLWFRAGIRRALQAPWLPLWVDNAQDVGGQSLPDVGGPVVILRTTHDAAIGVRRASAEEAA